MPLATAVASVEAQCVGILCEQQTVPSTKIKITTLT